MCQLILGCEFFRWREAVANARRHLCIFIADEPIGQHGGMLVRKQGGEVL